MHDKHPSAGSPALRGPAVPDGRTPSAAQRAQDLPWTSWYLEEERTRTTWLLTLIFPAAVLAVLLDLRLEGPSFWFSLGLRLIFLCCLAGALFTLVRRAAPQRFNLLLSVGILTIALLLSFRYALGLGLDGTPGHLPSDMIIILFLFLLPGPVWVPALGTAAIAITSGVDYIYWKEVHGASAALLVVTLMLAWGVGLGTSLGRRAGLRKRHEALREVYLLRSSIPICAWCKSIRDDAGIWKRLETYLEEHADMMLTHGVCPNCMAAVESEDTEQKAPH